jgi:hypothetical protein
MSHDPGHDDLSRLPRDDQPPAAFRRQYATLAEFERACGDNPDTVEEWLASRYPKVIGRDDPSVRWLIPWGDGTTRPPQSEQPPS